MNVTTGTAGLPATAPEAIEDTPARVVDRLRQSLHRAAREGKLNAEVGEGICYSFIGANVALDSARDLIRDARDIEAAAAERRANPVQDCGNPMGQTNVPSCAERVLTAREDRAAAALAEALVSGPWPLF